ncbi:pre-mRNA-splicing factor 8 [Ascochyta rabiei]|uniref:pre-mRNA-splicing factor 8 n=1 Tax=Didymella rabiei TaxID=5454 RepID=UPI0019004411|nr:pre-mRNA-splicing factor 8 [Ascochyta rabiei]UPX11888.1 pre-mRNA-splicing factor 8 [Ascochyta rabiei]
MLPSSSSSSSSSFFPLHPRHILTIAIHLATLQLIAALLLTLMLLWHISTTTLVENYRMPQWWVDLFLAEHASAWRVGVWVGVGVLVPVDCVLGLLGVDWGCAVLRGKEGEGSADVDVDRDEDVDERRRERERNDYRTHAASISQEYPHTSFLTGFEINSTPACQPYTLHPFLHPRLPPTAQLALLTLFDLLMLSILTAHIATYIVSLPTALAFCYMPAVLAHPDYEFGDTNVLLSMRDRCIGLNVDIHVAGGFAVFMAIVLGLLHLAALAARIWAVLALGRDGVLGKRDAGGMRDVGMGSVKVDSSRDVSPGRASSALGSMTSRHSVPRVDGAMSSVDSCIVSSVGAEERCTGIGIVDRSAERAVRRGANTTRGSEAWTGSAMWNEVLLECLIDG